MHSVSAVDNTLLSLRAMLQKYSKQSLNEGISESFNQNFNHFEKDQPKIPRGG